MSAESRGRMREREERRRKKWQRRQARATVVTTNPNIQRDADYIIGRALDRDARSLTLGPLLFFSTATGDAWMLDTEDNRAVCLAREGQPQPSRIVETETTTGVDWNFTYAIDGPSFTTIENETGQASAILGSPTDAILAAMELAKKASGPS